MDSNQPPTQQVNISGDGGMGLTGWWKIAGQTTAMVVITGSFLYLQHQLIGQNREDRREDRAMFRESLKDIQGEDNRRAGEIKGSIDALNGATNDLSREIKGWRQDIKDKRGGPP